MSINKAENTNDARGAINWNKRGRMFYRKDCPHLNERDYDNSPIGLNVRIRGLAHPLPSQEINKFRSTIRDRGTCFCLKCKKDNHLYVQS